MGSTHIFINDIFRDIAPPFSVTSFSQPRWPNGAIGSAPSAISFANRLSSGSREGRFGALGKKEREDDIFLLGVTVPPWHLQDFSTETGAFAAGLGSYLSFPARRRA